MFTVVILSKRAKRIYSRYSFLFQRLISDGQITFCDWIESSESYKSNDPEEKHIYASVPGIANAIKGKTNWRAVVVLDSNSYSEKEAARRFSQDNPFDFNDSRDPVSQNDLDFKDSNHPVVRLAQALLGYPNLTPYFVAVYDFTWYDLEKPSEKTADQTDFVQKFSEKETKAAKNINHLINQIKSYLDQKYPNGNFLSKSKVLQSDKIHYQLKIPQDDETIQDLIGELSLYRNFLNLHKRWSPEYPNREDYAKIAQKYNMDEDRPSEVILVSTKRPEPDGVRKSSELLNDRESSDEFHSLTSQFNFVARNHYPNGTKFVVYDLVEPQHSAYDRELFKFWVSVCTLATAKIPPSSFQSSILYSIDWIAISESIKDQFTEYGESILSFKRHIDQQLSIPRPRIRDLNKEILQAIPVSISTDQFVKESDLTIDVHLAQLFSNHPGHESNSFSQSISHNSKKLDSIPWRYKQILRLSASETRNKIRSTEVNVDLDENEFEDLQQILANSKIEQIAPPPKINPQTKVSQLIAQAKAEILDFIHKHPPRSFIICSLLFYLAGLCVSIMAPIAFEETKILIYAIILMGIFGLGSIAVTIFKWKQQLKNRLERLNQIFKDYVREFHNSLNLIRQYFKKLAYYMYGSRAIQKIQRYSSFSQGRRTQLLHYQSFANSRIQTLKSITDALDEQIVFNQSFSSDFDINDTNESPENNYRFAFPLVDSMSLLENSNEEVPVQFPFIKKIILEKVPIFEGNQNRSEKKPPEG